MLTASALGTIVLQLGSSLFFGRPQDIQAALPVGWRLLTTDGEVTVVELSRTAANCTRRACDHLTLTARLDQRGTALVAAVLPAHGRKPSRLVCSFIASPGCSQASCAPGCPLPTPASHPAPPSAR